MPRLRLGKPQALIHLFVHLFVYFSMFYLVNYLFIYSFICLFKRATIHARAQKHAHVHEHKSTTQRPQQTTVSSKLVWWSRFSLSPNDHTAAH